MKDLSATTSTDVSPISFIILLPSSLTKKLCIVKSKKSPLITKFGGEQNNDFLFIRPENTLETLKPLATPFK